MYNQNFIQGTMKMCTIKNFNLKVLEYKKVRLTYHINTGYIILITVKITESFGPILQYSY